MSNIDAQIQKLRELEKKLEQDKRKIEFLNHILESAQTYDHKAFKDVKEAVVAMLAAFVNRAVEAIDRGSAVSVSSPEPTTQNAQTFGPDNGAPTAPPTPKKPAPQRNPSEASPAEKLNFALDHRHLAGKTVSVANDKNMIVKGKVVGLDAPFVLVTVDNGPTIKVPVDNVSVI